MEKKRGSRGEEGVKVVKIPESERVAVCTKCDAQEWIVIINVPEVKKNRLCLGDIVALECVQCGDRVEMGKS